MAEFRGKINETHISIEDLAKVWGVKRDHAYRKLWQLGIKKSQCVTMKKDVSDRKPIIHVPKSLLPFGV